MNPMPGKQIRLSQRLEAVVRFVEKGANVADIGTDHGQLPVYLAQKGLAGCIIASDISADSLKSAMRTATEYDVADKISFIVAHGLSGVGEMEVDTIVLSGMGGETIARILSEAAWTKIGKTKIIIQAQTKTDKLCLWLHENGYAILDAQLVRDRNRFYIVMLAQGLNAATLCMADRPASEHNMQNPRILNPEMELLSVLSEKGNTDFLEYLERLIDKTRRALEGMEKSDSPDYPQTMARLNNLLRFRKQ